MEITEVRIKLMEDSDDRLQGFCSVTFDDCFVIRDLKIIEGSNGPFVAMPSRKLTSHCPSCRCKNHLRAVHCNQCGGRLNSDRASRDAEGRVKLYADIAHPINSACREKVQREVIAAYREEREQSQQPGYMSRYDDAYDDEIPVAAAAAPQTPASNAANAPAAKTPGSEKHSHIEPAEPVPPPPHTPTHPAVERVAKQSVENADERTADRADEQSLQRPKRPPHRESGGFGAGIL